MRCGLLSLQFQPFALSRPAREIIAFFALLDHAFERAIRHVGVARAEQLEGRQDAAQPTIAFMEWMDFEKNNGEDPGDQKRMQLPR